MKESALYIVFVLVGYVQSATPGSRTIWVEDVTPRFQTNKRTSSGLDLADHLTFRLSRGSQLFTLNLERNDDINSNTDMYFLRNMRNGRFRIVKSRNLEKENLAYYQDRDNGASMIARCVKRSNEYCDRVIVSTL
ncbi:hypothetical protein CHS0354_040628 [Potamilus streckersoni]|uniref:Uncharacterized protein n=1 Tax=Potamilus streckersoni TaxID=2493646 RepID=A0AAE0SGN5_9BIVA|nr:hypothetical protein CHS0354_040628 [Potamilus streckersoni]